MEVTKIGEATPEEIAKWAADLGGKEFIKVIELSEADGKVSVGYVKKPNRIVLANAMSMVMDKQQIGAGEYLLDNCWLGGDMRMRSLEYADTDIRVAAAWAMYEQTPLLVATVKNV
jgi:hypothetical protein